MKLFCTLTLVLVVWGSLAAQTPADELKQLTAQIQATPNDRGLREKAIKIGAGMKPAPETPREAKEHEGAAEYILKNAKTEADYLKAAGEFEKAVLIAPWLAADYYNLGILYEKANQPEKSLLNFELYLASSPTGTEADDIVRKIGAMKYAAREADEKRRQAEDQQRQTAAAAEREYQRTAALREFRRYVEGKNYRLLVCSGGGTLYEGCNEKEFSGKNWFPTPDTHPRHWEFYEDAAYLKVANQYLIRVRPNGPSVNDLIWENPDILGAPNDTSRSRPWRYDIRKGFFQPSPDFSQIILGPGALDPKKRKQYFMYKTP